MVAFLNQMGAATNGVKSAPRRVSDTRAAVAKLEKFVIGNAQATNSQSGKRRKETSTTLMQ